MPKSDIPFGSEFSPERGIVLPELLGLLQARVGDRDGFVRAVYERFWRVKANGTIRPAGEGKGKEATGDGLSFATNTLYALAAYGLVQIKRDDPNWLATTEVGHRLIELRDDPPALYREFARHILVNLHGLDVIHTVKDMQAGGHSISVPEIAEHLRQRGLYVPPSGTHLNSMRQWLNMVQLFAGGWSVDQEKLDELLGVDEMAFEALGALEPEQAAFALALARLNVDEYSSEKVRDYAADVYGVKFPVKSLPTAVLRPLGDAGLITYEKTTSGRGAKPFIVRPTELLRKEVTTPILEGLVRAVGRQYRRLIRMPLREILAEINLPARETHRRGLGLEALALYLTRIIGLEFVGWRVRATETSYAEVDAIVEGTRLIFSRWQIQCKHTRSVDEGDVAKEVGLAFRLKSNVIMVITTGRFSSGALSYAHDMMRDTSYQIILVNGRDLDVLKADPAQVTAILTRQARHAMDVKRQNLPRLK